MEDIMKWLLLAALLHKTPSVTENTPKHLFRGVLGSISYCRIMKPLYKRFKQHKT